MDNSHSRPVGVTLAALLFLAVAILSLIIAARYVLNPAGNQEMILLFTRLKLPATFLNLLAVPPLISAGLATMLFRGLWEEKVWGRVAALFFSFIMMLAALAAIAFFQVFNFGGTRSVWAAAGSFVLFAIIFIYFLKIPWPDAEPEPAFVPQEAQAMPSATPAAAPPTPSQSLFPAEMTQPEAASAHSAPTVMTGVAAAAADTIILEPEPAPPSRPRACLTAISGEDRGRRFEFSDADILIGRHPTLADVSLSDPTISAQHARIRYEAGQFTLYDLDSTNGSFVNEQRIRMRTLHADDLITLGAVDLIFTTFCQD
jgi:hypothetical protein